MIRGILGILLMRRWAVLLLGIFVVIVGAPADGQARRTVLTQDQQERLQHAETVLITVLALGEKGRLDPDPLVKSVSNRMQAFGYHVVTDSEKPHDAVVKVKCEERKTWEGTTPRGGDMDSPEAPARLWKGPACQFTYMLDGQELGWVAEMRTPFEDAVKAAEKAGVQSSGEYAMQALAKAMNTHDFPILLGVEWHQGNRLLDKVNDPNTGQLEKARILSALSNLQVEGALPQLQEVLEDRDLAEEAIAAMSGAGPDSVPMLQNLVDTSNDPKIRAAAIKALGKIGARSGDARIITPLLRMVEAHKEKTGYKVKPLAEALDVRVLTEIVWAFGKVGDTRAQEPVDRLYEDVWMVRDNSEEMEQLREALSWTYKHIHKGGYIDALEK